MADAAFSNDPIDVSAIPQLRDDDFVSMHPNFLRVSLLGRLLFALVVVGAALTVLRFAEDIADGDQNLPVIVYAVAGGLIASTILSAVLKIFEIRNIAYQVRHHDLSYRDGVIVKRVQTVPFVRVQHARMRQGPVQRLFKIATLNINSAGPDIVIQGLGDDDASRLRALVVERAGDLVEEQ